jgi:hypothetical protein
MAWINVGYFDEWKTKEDWNRIAFVSDGPGRTSPHWRRAPLPAIGQKRPKFAPAYEVGDELLVYTTSGRCPAIVRVVDEPRWDPDAVDAAYPGEGDRWGMYTPVTLVTAVDLAAAPPLETLGVPRRAVARRWRLIVEEWVLEDARRTLGAPARRRRRTGRPKRVPIENASMGTFDVSVPAGGVTAQRRESRLVRDLQLTLEALGHRASRHQIPQDGTGPPLYTDLFDETTKLLVEAKSSSSRPDVRMAIGQLLDYSRWVRPKHQAVLLEARPHADLVALLRGCGVAVIWRAAGGFVSTHPRLIS